MLGRVVEVIPNCEREQALPRAGRYNGALFCPPPETDMPALKHCQKWGLAQAVCYLWLDCCSPACSVKRNSEGPGTSS